MWKIFVKLLYKQNENLLETRYSDSKDSVSTLVLKECMVHLEELNIKLTGLYSN